MPSALAALGHGGDDVLGIGPARVVVVLVVDGLGWHQLRAAADVAPFLASRDGRSIDAAVPTTTVTGLATLGTGRPPGEHGLLGYTVAHPDHGEPFNLLTWRVGLRGGGRDVRTTIVPEAVQPGETLLERAHAGGITTTCLLHPDFLDSGLTRAVLRGGQRVAVTDLEATVAAVRAEAGRPGKRLVYAHHGTVDTAGHVEGPGSPGWGAALRDLDAVLEATVAALAGDTTVVVTADHGMVQVPDDDVVELADEEELMRDVRVLAGEPRLRQLACRPGTADAVAARWRTRLGDRADVRLREETIAAGWFGSEVSAAARRSLGDVLVAMTRGVVVHRRVDPHGGRLRGHHGSLTPDEMAVPLLTLRGGRA